MSWSLVAGCGVHIACAIGWVVVVLLISSVSAGVGVVASGGMLLLLIGLAGQYLGRLIGLH